MAHSAESTTTNILFVCVCKWLREREWEGEAMHCEAAIQIKLKNHSYVTLEFVHNKTKINFLPQTGNMQKQLI